MKLTTLLVCDAGLDKRQTIEDLIHSQNNLALIGTVAGGMAREQIASLHPKLVWIELSPAPVRGLSLLAELREAYPQLYFFVSYEVPDPELIRTAYRLGASDFLDAERWRTDLPAAVQSIMLKHQSESVSVAQGKVIAVFSPTGGIGATTITTNLAGYLSKHGETAIVDLDLQFGMVAHYLNLEPSFSLSTIDFSHTNFDATYLRNLMTKYDDKLSILAAPPELEDIGDIYAAQIQEILNTAKSEFKYVVVDLPKNLLDERAIASLDFADHVIVLTEYNWSAILNARKCLDTFKAHYNQEKLLLVINRAEWLPHDVLSECRANLNYPVFAEIPSDAKTAKWVNNQGQIAPGHTALGKAMDTIARRFAGAEKLLLTAEGDKAAGFKLPGIFAKRK
ncbi:MAG: AAA family ATPase [Candidatus Obscuribacterales bacterium]|nr:AAA family ATPase [Candidatus Obscuribacterales bacterium]